MNRRLKLRRQNSLLLISMRLGYGGTIVAVRFTNTRSPGSLLSLVHQYGGFLSHLLISALVVSAGLLIIDALLDLVWPAVKSQRATDYFSRTSWLRLRWLDNLRVLLVRGCTLANSYRHCFYLPPALAALFVVPAAVYIGGGNVKEMKWLWLWLFFWGFSAAVLEGVISNERHCNAEK